MSEKRTLTSKLSNDLAQTYADHQKVLANVLLPFAQLRAKPADMLIAKFKIKEIVRRLDVAAVRWTNTAIDDAYKSKRAEVSKLAEAAAVFSVGDKMDRGAEAVARLTMQTAKTLLEINATITKTTNTFLSAYETAISGVQTAKQNAQFMEAGMEAEISRKVDWYLARGYDEGSISRKLRNYLSELVDGKNFIEINGRFYELKALAENLARTALHESYVQATIDECNKWDCDLMQFSRHDSPCELCAPLEGMVFSISGEDEEYPSLDDTVTVDTDKGPVEVDPKAPHPNCCLPGTSVEVHGIIIAASRSIYGGHQFDIILGNLTRLSVTENHLLLTPYGFAPAHLLRKGDYVLYSPGTEWVAAINPNDYRNPSLIEDVFESLSKTNGVNSRTVPVTAENFHGDGRFIDGNVDIIGANSFLGDTEKPGLPQEIVGDNFRLSDMGASNLPCGCDFATVFKRLALAADGIMGGIRAPSPFFLARPAGSDPMAFADSSEIATDLGESQMNVLVSHSKLLCEIALQSTRPIMFQKIIAVDVFPYHGFVYDLQTETSLYIANGILSSNCEHNMNPVTRAILEAAGER